MKFIFTNLITNVASSAGNLSADYAIAKVENNFPKQPYIASTTNPTVTVTCASASAFFVSYLAEALTMTFKDSGGSTLGTETFSNSYTLSEAYLLNDRTHWNEGAFATCPTNTNTVELAFANTTDVKSTINGWVTGSSGQLGRLQASSANILLEDYPQIKLGTFVNSAQINRITGDGTGSTDLQLTTGGDSSFTVTSMKFPVLVNTIRAGAVLDTLNPSVGMTEANDSTGIQQERDSGLVFRLGEIRRRFAGSVQVLEADRPTASKVFSGLRMQPVAAKIISYQTSSSVFGAFLQPPTLAYSQQGSQIYDYNFEFVELI